MDELTHQALLALGDGGTVEMADRVAHWVRSRDGCVPPERIGGLTEVAMLVGRRKQTVCNWLARGTQSCPHPIPGVNIAATKLYDLDQWRVWAIGNPELVRNSL